MQENNDDLEFNIKLNRSLTSERASTQESQDPKQNNELNVSTSTTNSNSQGRKSLKEKLPKFLQNSSHPGICVLQFIFKLMAIVSYLLLNIFVDNLVLVYIIVIVLQALDFYVVKNITGRILVGLRWWSMIKEDGNEEWVFESLDHKNENVADGRIFWITSYAAPIMWVLLIIVSALSFSLTNITICIYGCVLTGTNLMGYMKCEKSHKSKVQGFLFDQAKKNLSLGQMAKITQFASRYNQ